MSGRPKTEGDPVIVSSPEGFPDQPGLPVTSSPRVCDLVVVLLSTTGPMVECNTFGKGGLLSLKLSFSPKSRLSVPLLGPYEITVGRTFVPSSVRKGLCPLLLLSKWSRFPSSTTSPRFWSSRRPVGVPGSLPEPDTGILLRPPPVESLTERPGT